MSATAIITIPVADLINELRHCGIWPDTEGRHAVTLAGNQTIGVFARVTADEARQIADRWQDVADTIERATATPSPAA